MSLSNVVCKDSRKEFSGCNFVSSFHRFLRNSGEIAIFLFYIK